MPFEDFDSQTKQAMPASMRGQKDMLAKAARKVDALRTLVDANSEHLQANRYVGADALTLEHLSDALHMLCNDYLPDEHGAHAYMCKIRPEEYLSEDHINLRPLSLRMRMDVNRLADNSYNALEQRDALVNAAGEQAAGLLAQRVDHVAQDGPSNDTLQAVMTASGEAKKALDELEPAMEEVLNVARGEALMRA